MNVNANKALQLSFTMSTSSLVFEIASFNYSQSLCLYTNQSKLFLSSVWSLPLYVVGFLF